MSTEIEELDIIRNKVVLLGKAYHQSVRDNSHLASNHKKAQEENRKLQGALTLCKKHFYILVGQLKTMQNQYQALQRSEQKSKQWAQTMLTQEKKFKDEISELQVALTVEKQQNKTNNDLLDKITALVRKQTGVNVTHANLNSTLQHYFKHQTSLSKATTKRKKKNAPSSARRPPSSATTLILRSPEKELPSTSSGKSTSAPLVLSKAPVESNPKGPDSSTNPSKSVLDFKMPLPFPPSSTSREQFLLGAPENLLTSSAGFNAEALGVFPMKDLDGSDFSLNFEGQGQDEFSPTQPFVDCLEEDGVFGQDTFGSRSAVLVSPVKSTLDNPLSSLSQPLQRSEEMQNTIEVGPRHASPIPLVTQDPRCTCWQKEKKMTVREAKALSYGHHLLYDCPLQTFEPQTCSCKNRNALGPHEEDCQMVKYEKCMNCRDRLLGVRKTHSKKAHVGKLCGGVGWKSGLYAQAGFSSYFL